MIDGASRLSDRKSFRFVCQKCMPMFREPLLPPAWWDDAAVD